MWCRCARPDLLLRNNKRIAKTPCHAEFACYIYSIDITATKEPTMHATASTIEPQASPAMKIIIGFHAGITAAVLVGWLALEVADGAFWAVTAATVYAVAAPVIGGLVALRMMWGGQ
jgi:hypothetical protein